MFKVGDRAYIASYHRPDGIPVLILAIQGTTCLLLLEDGITFFEVDNDIWKLVRV